MNALRFKVRVTTVFLLLVTFLFALVSIAASNPFDVPVAAAAYSTLPMRFEVNEGQTASHVKFLARGNGYNLFLTSSEAVLHLKRSKSGKHEALSMKLPGANPSPRIVGLEELPGKSNYLIGNDRSKWRTNVSQYAKVKYESVYSGIDMVFYGNEQHLEYDFNIAPGSDPANIKLEFKGAKNLSVDTNGELVLRTEQGEIRQRKPFLYQQFDDERREVSGRYVKKGKYQVGFEIAEYDHARTLVIDPVLVYSTYLGGGADDQGFDIAIDAAGNSYVTGYTLSANLPTSPGAFDATYNGGPGGDVFVAKFNPTGSGLVYLTYIGGSASEEGHDIAVDDTGNVYLTGFTQSSNFPITSGAFDTSFNGPASDAFVAKLNASGTGLIYSTFLGGTGGSNGEHGNAIAIDALGNAYVAGDTDSQLPDNAERV